jgi:hypothetical protein
VAEELVTIRLGKTEFALPSPLDEPMRQLAAAPGHDLKILADGDAGLFAVGGKEHFNLFFDYIDDDLPYDWRALSTYTAEEIEKIEHVLTSMLTALDATASLDTEAEIAATGWPQRVQPVAQEALTAMIARGRFDEEREETEPSHR